MNYKQLITRAISEARLKTACRLLERLSDRDSSPTVNQVYLILVDGIQYDDYYHAAVLALKIMKTWR